VACTIRRASGLHIKLGCGKGRARGLPISAARRPALFRSPPARHSVFCAEEVVGVTFSDSDSAPVPKFFNPDPGPAILQI